MLPLTPLIPLSNCVNIATIQDQLSIAENDGSEKVCSFTDVNRMGDYLIERTATGSLNEGIVYSIDFLDCQEHWMTKIQVKEISVSFGPLFPDGEIVKKGCGTRIFHHRDLKEKFLLTTEEIHSIFPKEGKAPKEIPVTITLIIEKATGHRFCLVSHFDFTVKSKKSNLVVLFEDGKKFYVNAVILSIRSAFFDNLVYRLDELPTDEESDLPLLLLNGYQSDAFHWILYALYPTNREKRPLIENKGEILRLASFLACETLLKTLDRSVAGWRGPSQAQKLIWSVEYKLPRLQSTVINRMRYVEDLEELRKDPLYDELPKEVLIMIIDRYIKVLKEAAQRENEGQQ